MAGVTFTVAGGMADTIFGKWQDPIKMMITKRAEEMEKKSVINKIFAPEKSKHYAESYGSMTAMDGFKPVGENGATPQSGWQEGYKKTIENVTWKNGFSISREAIEDSQLIDLRKRPEAFIAGYHRTREHFAAAMLGGAIKGSTSVTFEGTKFPATTADGVTLFHTNHPSILGKGTQSNKFADAFSVDALDAVATEMQQFKGDNGELLSIAPDTIIIPNIHGLKKSVLEAVGSELSPDSANNAINAQYGNWNVVVWPYLNLFITANTTPWILVDSRYNELNDAAVWQERTPLDVESYEDKNTHANKWSGYARFSAGFVDFRAFAVGGVTGGTQLISGT